MLRSSNQKTYVCWRCLCSRPSSSSLPTTCSTTGTTGTSTRPRLRQPLLSATASRPAGIRGFASHGSIDDDQIRFRFQGTTISPIRQKLRTWEVENPKHVPIMRGTSDKPYGPINAVRERFGPQEAPTQNDSAPHLDGEDALDIGDAVPGLQAGDLIELSNDSTFTFVAVCLGNFNGYDHFYTNSGKWFTARNVSTRFVVRGFILDPGDLKAVIDAIPTTVGDGRLLGQLATLNIGPTRNLGESLRSRMEDFLASARHYNHVYSESLNRASSLAGPVEKLMTLSEIARALLPASAAKTSTGIATFSPSLLYAVHSSICTYHELAFRPLHQHDRLYQDYLYSVVSEKDLKLIFDVEDTFRRAIEVEGGAHALGRVDPKFEIFIQRAQQAIDRSRRSREWSSCGMLGPAKKSLSAPNYRWSFEDMRYINFLRQWAASGRIPRQSRLHWVGAAILRATERYTEAEYLDCATGWTFLQEIGWTAPWDLHARHDLRLPAMSTQSSDSKIAAAKDHGLGPDLLASIRTDLESTTVYCIDSVTAQDIDDGVSLERTEKEGEYWINIHVADPGSRIGFDTALGKEAAGKAQTTYLSGYIEPMFTAEIVRQAFSLAPDRPSLTFSARVNEAGEILDYKVCPHILKDVVYMTPEDASAATGDDASSSNPFSVPSTCFEVGKPPVSQPSTTRKMTKPEELSEKQITDLRILNQLAKALQDVRLRNGAVPYYTPRARAEVSMENTTTAVVHEGFVHCTGDPYIRVAYDPATGSGLVSSLMQLAGYVAARWCKDRKIPIPYRTQILGEQNREQLKKFTTEVLYPKLRAGQYPTVDEMRVYLNLSGAFTISTRPAPNAAMGMDMYTKATSPLRRYADLVVHWQIEAALLEEHLRASSSPDGDNNMVTNHSLLPFSQKDMDEKILPHLLLRERYSKRLANAHGNKQWILQALVRAWRFGEGKEQLPETFRLTVDSVQYGTRVWGNINWFDLRCQIPVRYLGGILSDDVKVGDEFIVEIADVNVYDGYITCQVLSKV